MLPGAVYSQKTVSLNGKYTFILSDNDNITLKEAKNKSIENAKTEAMKKEFGSVIASDFITSERISDDSLNSYYLSDTSSSVKGEWLGDEREPEISMEYINGDLFITAEVWGTAREIVRAETDLKWQVLKDINGKKFEADVFDSGERFFVRFSSPSAGYVAIYLITEDNETACLLPYRSDSTGRYQIKGGKEYVFFDKSTDPAASYYKLSTNKPLEHNQLVIIFSPNPFTKCMDSKSGARQPNSLDLKEFSKWLVKNQRADNDMSIARKWLTIKGEE